MTVNISTDLDIPTLEEIRATRDRIDPHIVRTPVWRWHSEAVAEALGPDTEVWLKLELFQKTGTFKPRGAVNDLLQLGEAAKERGVTAVSAGNHAIAVAYAAQIFGCDAKVVMPESAPVFRVEKARSYGAEVVLVADVYAAFAEVDMGDRQRAVLLVEIDIQHTAVGAVLPHFRGPVAPDEVRRSGRG